MEMGGPMRIDVYADVVCPWGYVGMKSSNPVRPPARVDGLFGGPQLAPQLELGRRTPVEF